MQIRDNVISFCKTIRKIIMSLTNASPSDAAKAASESSLILARLSVGARNVALTAIHSALHSARDEILAANAHDLASAARSAAQGEMSRSLLKRIDLTKPGKWEDMLQGILDVKALEDPGAFAHLEIRPSITWGSDIGAADEFACAV